MILLTILKEDKSILEENINDNSKKIMKKPVIDWIIPQSQNTSLSFEGCNFLIIITVKLTITIVTLNYFRFKKPISIEITFHFVFRVIGHAKAYHMLLISLGLMADSRWL